MAERKSLASRLILLSTALILLVAGSVARLVVFDQTRKQRGILLGLGHRLPATVALLDVRGTGSAGR
jgi:hypothetical protein